MLKITEVPPCMKCCTARYPRDSARYGNSAASWLCSRVVMLRKIYGQQTMRYGSPLLYAGDPLSYVSEQMGHAPIMVPASVYAHDLKQNSGL